MFIERGTERISQNKYLLPKNLVFGEQVLYMRRHLLPPQVIQGGRKKAYCTQEQLAQALHVTRSTVVGWEGGRVLPTQEHLRTLITYFQEAKGVNPGGIRRLAENAGGDLNDKRFLRGNPIRRELLSSDRDFSRNLSIIRRTYLQWTQKQLADALHVSRIAVENWEKGLNPPLEKSLKKLTVLFLKWGVFDRGEEAFQIRALWDSANKLLDDKQLQDFLNKRELISAPISTYAFGDYLSGIRRKRHWTQEQLAQEVGVSRGEYGMWERGKKYPKEKNLGVLTAFCLREGVFDRGEEASQIYTLWRNAHWDLRDEVLQELLQARMGKQ